MTYLSQLKPSTLSLQTHLPVSTLHSSILPEGLQEHDLLDGKWSKAMREEKGERNSTLKVNLLYYTLVNFFKKGIHQKVQYES